MWDSQRGTLMAATKVKPAGKWGITCSLRAPCSVLLTLRPHGPTSSSVKALSAAIAMPKGVSSVMMSVNLVSSLSSVADPVVQPLS